MLFDLMFSSLIELFQTTSLPRNRIRLPAARAVGLDKKMMTFLPGAAMKSRSEIKAHLQSGHHLHNSGVWFMLYERYPPSYGACTGTGG